MMNRFCLTISSWIGFAGDAQHYMGTLHFYDANNKYKTIDLEKILTQKEATALNKADGVTIYKKGYTSERFNSEAEIIEAAKKKFAELSSTGDILFRGQFSICDPQLALAGPDDIVKKANAIYEKAKAINFWQNDEAAMNKISAEWDKLFPSRT